MILRVSLAFAKLPDPGLDAFTESVLDKMDENPAYPTPPVKLPDVKLVLDDFTAKLAAAAQGGKLATAAKDAARETLLGLLRQLAAYVQSACKNDLATLLSSGFEATDTNHASVPLDKPAILKVLNEVSGQLALRVQPVLNARAYEVRFSTNGGPFQDGGIFTQARHIVVANLTPGTTYTFQVRAIGGSTGVSEWSDPISHMAT